MNPGLHESRPFNYCYTLKNPNMSICKQLNKGLY